MQLAKRTMELASALLPALCLGACASSKPRVVVVTPPAERLTCKPEPSVPPAITDRSTADYLIALADAGQSCRSAFAWLRSWADHIEER